jgi:hypothetical protein
MPSVAVRILHPEPGASAGPLTRRLAEARARVAERHRLGFLAAGADDVEVVSGPPDDRSFGKRLGGLLASGAPTGGLVILGSGAIPVANDADRRAFVAIAASDERVALANNRYSADVVAIARLASLPPIPDLPGDNALPRWLEEVAGYGVDDLRRRWRLGFDLDSPLDVVLLGEREPGDALVADRLAAVRAVAADRRSELLVAGRSSAATLAWLERHTAGRVRAWVEERGLRASSRLAQGSVAAAGRAPASLLGSTLDRDGPASIGTHLARFADAAIIDSRVLLAHRLGGDEAGWPSAEDRFASDLLRADEVADPWLRELTASAVAAPIPILLGGHTLVGPGVRLVVDGPPRGARWM